MSNLKLNDSKIRKLIIEVEEARVMDLKKHWTDKAMQLGTHKFTFGILDYNRNATYANINILNSSKQTNSPS